MPNRRELHRALQTIAFVFVKYRDIQQTPEVSAQAQSLLDALGANGLNSVLFYKSPIVISCHLWRESQTGGRPVLGTLSDRDIENILTAFHSIPKVSEVKVSVYQTGDVYGRNALLREFILPIKAT